MCEDSARSTSEGRVTNARLPLNSDEQMARSKFCEFKTIDGRLVPSKLKSAATGSALKALERSADTQPCSRWPGELQMMYPPPHHISYVPHERPVFKEASPEIAAAYRDSIKRDRVRKGELVYQRRNTATSWFSPHRVTVGKDTMKLPSYYNPVDESDDTLVFESRFESGNLGKAYKASQFCYNLQLSTDLYTTRHTQWFYFRASNVRAGNTYTFCLNNLLKPDSLYNHGMQPCVYSTQQAELNNVGWHRAGFDICYFKNDHRVLTARGERYYYTLRFSWTASYDDDVVYFAHCYPYTYTDLQAYLTSLLARPNSASIVRLRTLCQTLAGNSCDLLTVTNYGVSQAEMALRKGVVISARVHPGETNASWMMKGFIDFITSNQPDAVMLRDHFVFKIVPMLNPDGVIVGNYRCSLSGVDLNRTYKHTLRDLYPTVFAIKLMMQRLARDREVVAYCDLHGHSRKHNVFVYGCHHKTDPIKLLSERVFPMMLGLNGPGHFSYKSSRFAVKRAKESTGRVVTWRMLNIPNVFTMEATFCGSTIGPLAGKQFTTADFEHLGNIFFDTLLDYCDPNPAKRTILLARLRQDALRRVSKQVNIPPGAAKLDLLTAMMESDDDESDGSNSSSSEGETELAEARFRFGEEALANERSASIARLKIQAIRSEASVKASPRQAASATLIAGKRKTRRKKRRSLVEARPASARLETTAPQESNGSDSEAAAQPTQSPRTQERRYSSAGSLRRKYNRLTNNGIPTFAQDRIRRRAEQRQLSPVTGSSHSVYSFEFHTDESSHASDGDDERAQSGNFLSRHGSGRVPSGLYHSESAVETAAQHRQRPAILAQQLTSLTQAQPNSLVQSAEPTVMMAAQVPTVTHLTLTPMEAPTHPPRRRQNLRMRVPSQAKGGHQLAVAGVPTRTMNLFGLLTDHRDDSDLRASSAERVSQGIKNHLLLAEGNG
eukprot:m.33382 g.33382  ORF g.33382 m.33382 type:complete len:950 (-) comp12228_c0_seq1:17-2866(-)